MFFSGRFKLIILLDKVRKHETIYKQARRGARLRACTTGARSEFVEEGRRPQQRGRRHCRLNCGSTAIGRLRQGSFYTTAASTSEMVINARSCDPVACLALSRLQAHGPPDRETGRHTRIARPRQGKALPAFTGKERLVRTAPKRRNSREPRASTSRPARCFASCRTRARGDQGCHGPGVSADSWSSLHKGEHKDARVPGNEPNGQGRCWWPTASRSTRSSPSAIYLDRDSRKAGSATDHWARSQALSSRPLDEQHAQHHLHSLSSSRALRRKARRAHGTVKRKPRKLPRTILDRRKELLKELPSESAGAPYALHVLAGADLRGIAPHPSVIEKTIGKTEEGEPPLAAALERERTKLHNYKG